jgi:hypothetical protein
MALWFWNWHALGWKGGPTMPVIWKRAEHNQMLSPHIEPLRVSFRLIPCFLLKDVNVTLHEQNILFPKTSPFLAPIKIKYGLGRYYSAVSVTICKPQDERACSDLWCLFFILFQGSEWKSSWRERF